MATKAKSEEKGVTPPVIPEVVTKKSLAIVEQKSITAAEQAGKIVIKTDADLAQASEYLSNLKALQKFVKQEKDKRLNPIKETKSWVEGLFEPIEERIENAEIKVKRGMADYHDKVTAENKKKADAIAARAQKEGPGSIKPETAVRKMEELGEVKTTVKTTAGASTFSKVKKVKVLKPEIQKTLLAEVVAAGMASLKAKDAKYAGEVAEALVPVSYWSIDEVTVRASALTESKNQNKIGVGLIPGVEVYEETIVGGRA